MQPTSPSSSPSHLFVPSMPLNERFAASHSRGQRCGGFGANGDLEVKIGDGGERAGKQGRRQEASTSKSRGKFIFQAPIYHIRGLYLWS